MAPMSVSGTSARPATVRWRVVRGPRGLAGEPFPLAGVEDAGRGHRHQVGAGPIPADEVADQVGGASVVVERDGAVGGDGNDRQVRDVDTGLGVECRRVGPSAVARPRRDEARLGAGGGGEVDDDGADVGVGQVGAAGDGELTRGAVAERAGGRAVPASGVEDAGRGHRHQVGAGRVPADEVGDEVGRAVVVVQRDGAVVRHRDDGEVGDVTTRHQVQARRAGAVTVARPGDDEAGKGGVGGGEVDDDGADAGVGQVGAAGDGELAGAAGPEGVRRVRRCRFGCRGSAPGVRA